MLMMTIQANIWMPLKSPNSINKITQVGSNLAKMEKSVNYPTLKLTELTKNWKFGGNCCISNANDAEFKNQNNSEIIRQKVKNLASIAKFKSLNMPKCQIGLKIPHWKH